MRPLPYLKYDPQDTSPQYLEDLACAYWFSEVLFSAVEWDLFTLLEPEGKSLEEIAQVLKVSSPALKRFLEALCTLGLVSRCRDLFCNTAMAQKYLVKGKESYLGDSILWRRFLASHWGDLKACLKAGGRVSFPPAEEDPRCLSSRIHKFLSAMDNVAKIKVQELLPMVEEIPLKGELLDVGAGSGAMAAGFLRRFPSLTATLLDLPHVLEHTKEFMRGRNLEDRVKYLPANVLEAWPLKEHKFNLIILSNLIHTYGEEEVSHILAQAAFALKDDGLLIIHDFFLEHYPEKAALFDLNMLINTYNGKVYSSEWVRQKLLSLGLSSTETIPLGTDTAVIFAAPQEDILINLTLNPQAHLLVRIKKLGFREARFIPVEAIKVSEWVAWRCRFGCDHYGSPHCPPYSPSPQETREILKDYTQALLLEGEPPTRDFQLKVLEAEGEAMRAGFYKAFAFWAGPCSLCQPCPVDKEVNIRYNAVGRTKICPNAPKARPSMEGAGIDVFETVRRAGLSLKTLSEENRFIKHFGLILLK